MQMETGRTLKCSIGGGMSCPSTIIWCFSRIRSCSASVRSRTNHGGRQLDWQCQFERAPRQ